ncbi:MAG: PKD domain-containing protein [Candidatus Aminicenantes bacterium]|nr:PKD domain-containing protein [Candidatus Aminicenantes bacterium]
MRKTGSVVVLILCLLFAFCALYAAEEVNQLGMHPFYKSRDLKKEDLMKIATKYADQVKAGFEMAGNADLYDDFMAQIQAADIAEIDVNPGDNIEWMIFKKSNKIEVKKDMVWTAKKPFTAYRFVISRELDEDGKKLHKDFEFIVPKVCGNISLKSTKVEDITPPPPPPPPPVNNPPNCILTVIPDEILAGQAVTLDASGSSDPDGTIASVKFVISKDGVTIEEKVLTAAPFVYTTLIKKAGNIKIAATVTDNEGLTAPGVCEKEITVLKRGFLIADIALLYQADPAWFLPIRAGYMHKLSKSIGVIILGGIAPVVSGDDDKTAILADLTLTYWPKSFFFGVGAGYFGSEMNKRFDLIVNTGVQIMPHVSLFLEGRVAFDEFDVIDKFGRIGIGFRLKY